LAFASKKNDIFEGAVLLVSFTLADGKWLPFLLAGALDLSLLLDGAGLRSLADADEDLGFRIEAQDEATSPRRFFSCATAAC